MRKKKKIVPEKNVQDANGEVYMVCVCILCDPEGTKGDQEHEELNNDEISIIPLLFWCFVKFRS